VTAEQIAAVLAEHHYIWTLGRCRCGYVCGVRAYEAHVAAALLPHIDTAAREAAAKAWDEGNARAMGYDLSYHLDRDEWDEERDPTTPNPYREEADR
jgi:post-segregation antitoxin (ccd killing protein)